MSNKLQNQGNANTKPKVCKTAKKKQTHAATTGPGYSAHVAPDEKGDLIVTTHR